VIWKILSSVGSTPLAPGLATNFGVEVPLPLASEMFSDTETSLRSDGFIHV